MSKSPWGNIGAWAAETERAEEEEREAAAKAAAEAQSRGGGASFPSLKEAVTTTTKQKKKTKMTLQAFSSYGSGGSVSAPSRGLTPEEMMRLPTGPKERAPDEMQYGTRLGGAFSNYGTRPGSGGGHPGRRSYGGFEDREPRVPVQEPSRADGVDNWASMKKALPDYHTGPARSGRYESLGGGGPSRADEVDNWAALKKPVSQPPPVQHQSRSSSFGSGFSRPDPDRWTRNEGVVERQRLVLDPPKTEPGSGGENVVVKVNKPSPFGAARPREEVLAEKGVDWKKADMEIEVKKQQQSASLSGSRPASSQSSRPGSAHSGKSEVLQPGLAEGMVKQKPKVNPFGDAKPREVLLEEKGLDWKKIDLDLEHRRVERPETEEEKILKVEIENLKKDLLQKTGEEGTSLQALILEKEKELELLIRKVDDKVRYSQKIFERQGTGVGRGAGFMERPPSRPGTYEEPTRTGFADRPPSRPGAYEEPRIGYEMPHSRPGVYEDSRAGFQERPPSRPGAYEDPRTGLTDRSGSRPGAFDEPRGGFPDRHLSRSGAYEDSRTGFPERSYPPGDYQEPRAVDYMERPRSRGTTNSWSRTSNDRRFQGGGRGFLGSRDVDRSGSRW